MSISDRPCPVPVGPLREPHRTGPAGGARGAPQRTGACSPEVPLLGRRTEPARTSKARRSRAAPLARGPTHWVGDESRGCEVAGDSHTHADHRHRGTALAWPDRHHADSAARVPQPVWPLGNARPWRLDGYGCRADGRRSVSPHHAACRRTSRPLDGPAARVPACCADRSRRGARCPQRQVAPPQRNGLLALPAAATRPGAGRLSRRSGAARATRPGPADVVLARQCPHAAGHHRGSHRDGPRRWSILAAQR